MNTALNVDLPTVHDNGMFISAKVSRIVELIREYDSNLDVKWVPPTMRGRTDPAFAITERLRDGREVVAFYVNTEAEFNEDVLARIYAGDNAKQDVQAMMEAKNKAVRAATKAKQREELEASYDFMASMIGSHKHTYRHGGRKYDL
jgi:hypothetical protein